MKQSVSSSKTLLFMIPSVQYRNAHHFSTSLSRYILLFSLYYFAQEFPICQLPFDDIFFFYVVCTYIHFWLFYLSTKKKQHPSASLYFHYGGKSKMKNDFKILKAGSFMLLLLFG